MKSGLDLVGSPLKLGHLKDNAVADSQQQHWLADIVESAPSIIFLALWRSDMDMETAGWIGVALAAAVLIGFRVLRLRYNPILLGINIHLVVITPLIVTVYALGASEFGSTLIASSERAVLVTVLIVGLVLTAFSRRGFIGVDDLSVASRWNHSSILLAALAAATVWSFSSAGGTLLTVALPMIGLFGLRHFLITRFALDR